MPAETFKQWLLAAIDRLAGVPYGHGHGGLGLPLRPDVRDFVAGVLAAPQAGLEAEGLPRPDARLTGQGTLELEWTVREETEQAGWVGLAVEVPCAGYLLCDKADGTGGLVTLTVRQTDPGRIADELDPLLAWLAGARPEEPTR